MNPKQSQESQSATSSVSQAYRVEASDIDLAKCLITPAQKIRPLQPPKNNESKVLTLTLNFLLLTSLSFVFIKLVVYHFQVIANFFPNEYREGAILLTTDLMVKGGNPYALVNQPEHTNVYGIFYHIIVLPFAKLFGTTLPVHRAVSAVFIWASCFVFFWAMRWKKISLLLALTSTLILYSHLLYFTSPLARPDSLGFFLFLCSLLVPWRYQYSFLSLIVSIVFGILGFLTKPYFILSIFYLSLYIFIFKSKKQGIQQAFLSLVFLGITLIGVDQVFETYLNNIFWINANVAGNNFNYALQQIFEYAKINLGVILIFFVPLGYSGVKLVRQPFSLVKFKELNQLFNIFELKKPLVNVDIGLVRFCLILSLLLFLGKFGQHEGSWLNYIHQLISPFLLFLAFTPFKDKVRIQKVVSINIVLTYFVVLNLLSISSAQFLPRPDYGLQEWHDLRSLISKHQNIFNSPAVVSILVEQGKKVYDSGQSEYFAMSAQPQGFWNLVFASNRSEIYKRYQQFLQEITQSLKLQKYDLVILTRRHSPFISEKLLKKNYQYQKTLTAPMSARVKRNWELDIWMPKVSETTGCELMNNPGEKLTEGLHKCNSSS